MKARSAVIWSALILTLCAAGYVWFKKNVEWVEVEIDGPMSVQARKHDLLAASRFLDELGYQTETIESGDFYTYLSPVTDTIFLQTLPDSLPEDAYERLLDWADGGGHLIVGLSGDNEGEGPVEFFESLGITHTHDFDAPTQASVPHVVVNKRGIYTAEIDGLPAGDSLTVEMDLDHMFTLWAGTPVALSGRVQGLFAFAQLEFGSGYVTVFADPRFWSNKEIGFGDNARLLAHVVASSSNEGSSVYISDRSTSLPGVFTLLWQRWQWFCLLMIVLGFALLRQAWVRFGPIQKDIEVRSNNYARHLLAVAQFQGRHQSYDRLLGPARQRVLNRYSRNGSETRLVSPSAANDSRMATDSGDVVSDPVTSSVEPIRLELLCRAQQASGIPVEQIETALFKSANKASITQIASTLQALDRLVEK